MKELLGYLLKYKGNLCEFDTKVEKSIINPYNLFILRDITKILSYS